MLGSKDGKNSRIDRLTPLAECGSPGLSSKRKPLEDIDHDFRDCNNSKGNNNSSYSKGNNNSSNYSKGNSNSSNHSNHSTKEQHNHDRDTPTSRGNSPLDANPRLRMAAKRSRLGLEAADLDMSQLSHALPAAKHRSHLPAPLKDDIDLDIVSILESDNACKTPSPFGNPCTPISIPEGAGAGITTDAIAADIFSNENTMQEAAGKECTKDQVAAACSLKPDFLCLLPLLQTALEAVHPGKDMDMHQVFTSWKFHHDREDHYRNLLHPQEIQQEYPNSISNCEYWSLMHWLIESCADLGLARQTYYAAAQFVAIGMYRWGHINDCNLQLLGASCLFVAAKLHEPASTLTLASLMEFNLDEDASEEMYQLQIEKTRMMFHKMEFIILNEMDWDCMFPTAFDFLARYFQTHALLTANPPRVVLPDQLKYAMKGGRTKGIYVAGFCAGIFGSVCGVLDQCTMEIELCGFMGSTISASVFFVHYLLRYEVMADAVKSLYLATGYAFGDIRACCLLVGKFVREDCVQTVLAKLMDVVSRSRERNIGYDLRENQVTVARSEWPDMDLFSSNINDI